MSTSKSFHVYAEDGFESAHRSESAAIKAARRGAKTRRVAYRVVRCDTSGFTGGGHGTVVWTSDERAEARSA